MKPRKVRPFSCDLKRMGKRSCFALALVGLLNLFFLPFIHFHPDNNHTHPGEFDSHQHKGHFHSHELENIAHWANVHPSDPEADEPLHHSHSSPEHDTDQVEYTTLALHTVDKGKHFTKPDFQIVTTVLQENYSNIPSRIQLVFSSNANRPYPVQQVRGPPFA